MLYIGSDFHGEYDLFQRLLEKINFSDSDRFIICGDILEKGPESVRLAKCVFSMPNIECILGNHEYAFLKFYKSLLEESPDDFDRVLSRLQAYFPDGHLLDWDTVDRIEALPLYIEEKNFICVHSGVPLGDDGKILPLKDASPEQLVFDRKFKNPELLHSSPKCVFFGHTETSAVTGKNKIIGYLKNPANKPSSISDFIKVHLDTGAWSGGAMSCLSVDTLKAYYVKKH